ncbi:MAG TPA: GNAT family N-acetyltransferase [Chitinophaga sp.]|uniref:GNAT family N-acetyltransferase n=1 Tax=Chitinophaga sp. TaxID=1869181 RepID=UPI002C13CD76|nr:GNAT family N-acetyltransferase [Chitinophaga sp.]HVI48079.1 GNAT family N-acetyltransferase [Chitinophaga sp.]
MSNTLKTNRLSLQPLTTGDAVFIFELVNTSEWKTFIGNRNVNTLEDAENYIRGIISNPDVNYSVVKIDDTGESVGIITFIKRAYLPHHDIGFAFLPSYTGQGLAFEAAALFISNLKREGIHQQLLATTLPENTRSIKLLERLGLKQKNEITVGHEKLLLFEMILI